jgi:hypothetical protein
MNDENSIAQARGLPITRIELAHICDLPYFDRAIETLRARLLPDIARVHAAWARLVKAECAVVDSGLRGEIPGAYQEQRDARQALRDLGVDVDALLEER